MPANTKALSRWLVIVAGLRLLSGETRSLSALPTANTQAACGPGADPCALFAAVYIGVFNVAQFRTRLIDLQPDLGERDHISATGGWHSHNVRMPAPPAWLGGMCLRAKYTEHTHACLPACVHVPQ